MLAYYMQVKFCPRKKKSAPVKGALLKADYQVGYDLR